MRSPSPANSAGTVSHGRAAPERLRPAARELADELVRFHDGSSWPPPRRVLVALLAGLYLVFAVAWILVDGFGWGAVRRPVPPVLVAVAPWPATRAVGPASGGAGS